MADDCPGMRQWGRLEATLEGIESTQTRVELKLDECNEAIQNNRLEISDTGNKLESHEASDAWRFAWLFAMLGGLVSVLVAVFVVYA